MAYGTEFLSNTPRFKVYKRLRTENVQISACPMHDTLDLTEVLKELHGQGYQLADAAFAAMPKEAIHSTDWRLDSLHRIRPEGGHSNHKVLIIAVSSRQKNLKLVFVEVLFPDSDFEPITLLRRLFPIRQPASRAAVRG